MSSWDWFFVCIYICEYLSFKCYHKHGSCYVGLNACNSWYKFYWISKVSLVINEWEVFTVLTVAHVFHCTIIIFQHNPKHIGVFIPTWHEFKNSMLLDNSHYQFLIIVELAVSQMLLQPTRLHSIFFFKWDPCWVFIYMYIFLCLTYTYTTPEVR